jgi:hypothetical protein
MFILQERDNEVLAFAKFAERTPLKILSMRTSTKTDGCMARASGTRFLMRMVFADYRGRVFY